MEGPLNAQVIFFFSGGQCPKHYSRVNCVSVCSMCFIGLVSLENPNTASSIIAILCITLGRFGNFPVIQRGSGRSTLGCGPAALLSHDWRLLSRVMGGQERPAP